MRKTLFLYLDGYSYEYLQETPYLAELAQKSLYGNLKVVPLHQFEFTVVTGVPPTEHELWAWYKYDPEGSPYRWMRKCQAPLKCIDRLSWIRRPFRLVLSYLNNLLVYATGGSRFVKIAEIPFDRAFYFGISAKRAYVDRTPMNIPTMFDLMRKAGLTYLACEWPLKGTNRGISLIPFVRADSRVLEYALANSANYDFTFAHLWTLDSLMHRYGIEHPTVLQFLRDLDDEICRTVNSFRALYPDSNVIISSDHGMVQITKSIDIREAIRRTGLKEGEDFLMFPGSTMVRFWFFEGKKKDIPRLLGGLERTKGGKVYHQGNWHELGVSYTWELGGDILFLADPGGQILPNYFDGYVGAKAMHGYGCSGSSMDGVFILNCPGVLPQKREDISLLDICPTVLDVCGLPIPDHCAGASVAK